MKTPFLLVPVLCALFVVAAGAAPASTDNVKTHSSFDRPKAGEAEESFPAGTLKFESADLDEVLKAYQQMSKRSVIRWGALTTGAITFRNEQPITRREALQALDTVLAANGVVMIPLGTRYVKAVPPKQALMEPAPVVELPAEQLPESNSYMTYIVVLKKQPANSVIHVLQPLTSMPNSIITYPDANLLIVRDYSSNVRRMLQVIERIDR